MNESYKDIEKIILKGKPKKDNGKAIKYKE